MLLQGFESTGVSILGCSKRAVTTALQKMSVLLCANVLSNTASLPRHGLLCHSVHIDSVFFKQFGAFSPSGEMWLFLSLILWIALP